MKKILLSLFAILPILLFAKDRSVEDALAIAENFFKQSTSYATRSTNSIQLVAVSNDLFASQQARLAESSNAFYVFNNSTSSYVIVSGDDRMTPVLGYSDNGAFVTTNLPSNILGWLKLYAAEYTSLNQNSTITDAAVVSSASVANLPASVAPLMGNINWDQAEPYNLLCPLYQGSRSVSGCVATAMAMVMKYHKYPTSGTGSYSYISKKINAACSYNYGSANFDWDNMLPEYVQGEYTTAQANAVADIMYACGVSVSMNYSPDGSGASAAQVGDALIKYFNYDENLKYLLRDYFDYSEWISMIKNEIANGRPILYNGATTDVGHEFIFDGYDENNLVHVNWGWSGMNNGYFKITSLDPESVGIGGGSGLAGGFIYQQGMIVGMQKPTSTSVYQSYFMIDKITLSTDQIKKGDKFTPVLNNIFNMSSTFPGGQIGLILEKDGVQKVISNAVLTSIPTFNGYSTYTWGGQQGGATFPTDVEDGVYLFYVGTKATDKENSWSRVRCLATDNGIYRVKVQGNDVQFISYWGDIDLTASVKVVHNLYVTKTADFEVTFTNLKSENSYLGQAGVAFMQNDAVVAIACEDVIHLEAAAANKVITLKGALPSTIKNGTYTIFPVAAWGEKYLKIGDSQEVTVVRVSGVSDVQVVSMALDKEKYGVSQPVRLVGELAKTGTSPIYDNTITIAIFDQTGQKNLGQFYQPVFIETGQNYNFDVEFYPNLPIGKYLVGLFKPKQIGTGYDQLPGAYTLNIVEATGINDATLQQEVIIYPQPVTDVLNVRCVESINSVEIYNLAGQCVMIEQFSANTNECSLQVGSFPAGSYILVLNSANKVYKQQFIKY